MEYLLFILQKAASVKEALEILVGRDQLEGVTGSKTKQEVLAWQQMNVEKLPPILILHLKWFDYRSDGCTKILKKVEFPVDLKIDASKLKKTSVLVLFLNFVFNFKMFNHTKILIYASQIRGTVPKLDAVAKKFGIFSLFLSIIFYERF